eukprot:764854-Hanusia_phi.AAC.2
MKLSSLSSELALDAAAISDSSSAKLRNGHCKLTRDELRSEEHQENSWGKIDLRATWNTHVTVSCSFSQSHFTPPRHAGRLCLLPALLPCFQVSALYARTAM